MSHCVTDSFQYFIDQLDIHKYMVKIEYTVTIMIMFGLSDAGVSGNDFLTFGNGNGNGSTHSQTLETGTGMKNYIPNFWEREWKFHSRILGMGMRRCYSRE